MRTETEIPSGIALEVGHIMYFRCIHYCKAYETEEVSLSKLRKNQTKICYIICNFLKAIMNGILPNHVFLVFVVSIICSFIKK